MTSSSTPVSSDGRAIAGNAASRRPGTRWLMTKRLLCSVPWQVPLSAIGVAALTTVVLRGWSTATMADLVMPLRMAALVLAVGVAGMLDDPLRPAADTLPTSLRRRQGQRVAVAGGVALVGWLVVALVIAGHHAVTAAPARASRAMFAGLTVEAAAMVLVVLAVAALVVRRRAAGGLLVAGGGLVVTVLALAVVPPGGIALFTPWLGEPFGPGEPWFDAHLWWATLAVLAAGVLVWAARDPYRHDLRSTIDRMIR